MELSEYEKQIIIAYRKEPYNIKYAVTRILGLEDQLSQLRVVKRDNNN